MPPFLAIHPVLIYHGTRWNNLYPPMSIPSVCTIIQNGIFHCPSKSYGGPGGHAMRRYLSAECDVTVDDDNVTVDDDDVTVDDEILNFVT